MTTFASIALYLIAATSFGTFGAMTATGDSKRQRFIMLSLFAASFTTAAGLQVFG